MYHDPSVKAYQALVFMEAAFYVNAASLFVLSALIERQNLTKKEMTSVNMPVALIEGGEAYLFIMAFMAFSSYKTSIFWIFGSCVWYNIVHRGLWAFKNLK